MIHMSGFVWPQEPQFAADSERRVFEALRRHLNDGDALICGQRFTDHTHGDVEADFIVFLAGVGVAAIEVKGGRVSYANGQWTSQSATEAHVIHPTDQARKARYALREFIEKHPDWSRGDLRDGWLIVLPDTDVDAATVLAPDAPRSVVIGRNDLDQALGLVYDHLADPNNTRRVSARGWVDAALDLLLARGTAQRDVIAEAAVREAHGDALTREQASVLDQYAANQYVEVRGGAGTGKSWLALEQARQWSRDGLRVALLSFGRGLGDTLRAQFASTKRQHRPAFIGTFHQLGSSWGVVAPKDAPSVWWTEIAPAEMTVAANALAEGHKFDAIVVDEAQDFSDNWWTPLLASLRNPEAARIATFRDDNQAVFGRRGRPDLPFAIVTLNRNLRNTRQIGNAFAPLVEKRPELLGGNGSPVTFVPCAAEDVVSTADDQAVALLDEGWDHRDIALLTTCHRHPVQREQQSDGSGSYWENLWSGDDIFYATVAGFKGLERPAVVVAVDGFREDANPRDLLYVAMSRARDKLVVVADPAVLRAANLEFTPAGTLRVIS